MIEDCQSLSSSGADSVGGAIHAQSMLVESSARLNVRRCVATGEKIPLGGHGGAVFCRTMFTQSGGEIEIYDCVAHASKGRFFSSAGGIHSDVSFNQSDGNLVIRNCSAAMDRGGSGRGGAIHAASTLHTSGRMYIEGSTARASAHGQSEGGAMLCQYICTT